MKRKILSLAIAGSALLNAGLVNAEGAMPTVYGKMNVSLQANDYEAVDNQSGNAETSQDNWTLNSNASRLGIKGDIAITDTLKAIYKAEYEIFVDDGADGSTGDEFSQRNIYAGLQGGFGTVLGGKHDSPLKVSQGDVDRFNDLDRADIAHVMVGENRLDNIMAYQTPSFGGFQITAAVTPGEDPGVDGATAPNDDDGFADHISAAVTFKNDMLYLALAADDDVVNTDIVRLTGDVTLGNFKVGAMYQMAEVADEDEGGINAFKAPVTNLGPILDETAVYEEQDAYMVNGQVTLGQIVLKAQYAFSETSVFDSLADDTETTQMAIGADYNLSDAAKLFAYYAVVEAEADAGVADDVEDNTFGVGAEVKF